MYNFYFLLLFYYFYALVELFSTLDMWWTWYAVSNIAGQNRNENSAEVFANLSKEIIAIFASTVRRVGEWRWQNLTFLICCTGAGLVNWLENSARALAKPRTRDFDLLLYWGIFRRNFHNLMRSLYCDIWTIPLTSPTSSAPSHVGNIMFCRSDTWLMPLTPIFESVTEL
jgi:hypothetical protein